MPCLGPRSPFDQESPCFWMRRVGVQEVETGATPSVAGPLISSLGLAMSVVYFAHAGVAVGTRCHHGTGLWSPDR